MANSGGSARSAPPPPQVELFIVLPDGSCTPATPKACKVVMKQARDALRKQRKIKRHEKAVELQMALEDRAAARRLLEELAELARGSRRWAARFKVKAEPEKPETRTSPVQKRLVTKAVKAPRTLPGQALPDSSWVVDDHGMRGIIWQQSYLGRKSPKFYRGAARDNWEYIVRDEAVLLDADGEPIILSNMGEDWVEIGAAWQAMEDASTRKNAKIQILAIAPFDSDMSREEMVVALRHFCTTVLEPLGLPYSAAIHAPPEHGDERNFHPHIAFSLRPMRRVAAYCWDVGDEVCGELDGRDGVQTLRHLWAHSMSEAAEQAKRNMAYTGLGYGARGLDLEAGTHLGEGRSAIVARGGKVWAHERNRIRNARNAARRRIRDLDHKIAALTKVRDAAVARQATELKEVPPCRRLLVAEAAPAASSRRKAVPPVATVPHCPTSTVATAPSGSTTARPAASWPPAQASSSPAVPRSPEQLGNQGIAPVSSIVAKSSAAPPPQQRAVSRPTVAPQLHIAAAITSLPPSLQASTIAEQPFPGSRGRTRASVPSPLVRHASARVRADSPELRAADEAPKALPQPIAVSTIGKPVVRRTSEHPQASAAALVAWRSTNGDLGRVLVPGGVKSPPPRERTASAPSAAPPPDPAIAQANAMLLAIRAAKKRAKDRQRSATSPAQRAARWRAVQIVAQTIGQPPPRTIPSREWHEHHPQQAWSDAAAEAEALDRRRLNHLETVDAYVADLRDGSFDVGYAAIKAIGVTDDWIRRPDVQQGLSQIRAQQQRLMTMLAAEADRRPLAFAKNGTRFWPRDLEKTDLARLDRWASDPGFQDDVFAIERNIRAAHEAQTAERRAIRKGARPVTGAPKVQVPLRLVKPIPDGFGGIRDTPPPVFKHRDVGPRVHAFDPQTGKPSRPLLELLRHCGEYPQTLAFAGDGKLVGMPDTPKLIDPLIRMWRADDRVAALIVATVRASREAGRPVYPESYTSAIRALTPSTAPRPLSDSDRGISR